MAAQRWNGIAATLTASVAATALSYGLVKTGRARLVDAPVRRALEPTHHPVADRVVGLYTDLGSIYALAGISVALAASGRVRVAVDVAAAGSAAWAGAQAAKPLLVRLRPYETSETVRLVAPPAGTSWPSGHAALATAVATTLAGEFGPRGRRVLASQVAAVGVSRCYVGVHHATDVVAGIGVGAIFGRIGRTLARAVFNAAAALSKRR